MKSLFQFNKNHFLILQLDPAKRSLLVEYLVEKLRNCYISPDRLERAKTNNEDLVELMKTYVPDQTNIKSAEFAEISTYLLLPSKTGFNLEGPAKWRWKEDKNTPVKKTDVLLFETNLQAASSSDLIVHCEVKSKSMQASSSPLKAAIDDVKKDQIGRLAKTLIWYRERAIQNEDGPLKAAIDRFIDVGDRDLPTYQKHAKAVLFIDEALLETELKKEYGETCHDNMEIFVVAIPNLRSLYEEIYDLVINKHD